MPQSPRKVERVALLDQVYEILKERILDRVYDAGARLNIDALGRELKVSSTPLREALARLTAEGLVRAEPFVGFAVAPMPDSKYYRDLYAFRLVLEPWAAAEAARLRSARTLQTLEAAVRAMGGSPLSRRYRRFRDFSNADDLFHRAIVAGTGNEPACKAYEDLRIHLHMSRLYIHREQDAQSTQAEHLAIVDAIRAGDSEEAAQRMREHLIQSQKKLLD